MSWRNTWLLVGIAAALFAFIFLFERHLGTSDNVSNPQPLLAGFKAARATSLQLRKGSTFVINLVKTNGAWQYTSPFSYPAASPVVQSLLETFDQLLPVTYITPQEILARKQTSADFGFDAPAIVIRFENGNERQDVRFGAHTPANDQIYVDVVNVGDTKTDERPGIYVVNASILAALPRTQNDWRETGLFSIPPQKVDLLDVNRAGSGGFAVQRDATNKLWRLTRPAHRADQLQVDYRLREIAETRIAAFISDDPRVDLEAFGLQTPAAELTVGGGGQLQKVQFGRSPTNDPTQVYARQLNTTNVVLVPKKVFDLVTGTAYTDLRDQRLLGIQPEIVDTIEVTSEEPFVARRQTNGTWTVADLPVDWAFVNETVNLLSRVTVREFVKDVVTDFTPFGLVPPRLRMTLRSTATVAGVLTNIIVGQLDFGSNQTAETVFVRRWDESSVYTIHAIDFARIPSAGWQLRDHRVWSFATNQVVRVIARQDDKTRQYIRQPTGAWASTTGEADPFALEEMMFRLGDLHAVSWVGRGEAALARYNFSPADFKLSIEVKVGDTNRMLNLQFGGRNALQLPYAATAVDGEPWVFIFPWTTYWDLQRYLSPTRAGQGGNPAPRAPPAGGGQ